MYTGKFWKVTIHESDEGFGKRELTNVFFHEENQIDADEYVTRMREKTDAMSAEYYWYVDDPVLVDEIEVDEFNGADYLNHIRNRQESDTLIP